LRSLSEEFMAEDRQQRLTLLARDAGRSHIVWLRDISEHLMRRLSAGRIERLRRVDFLTDIGDAETRMA